MSKREFEKKLQKKIVSFQKNGSGTTTAILFGDLIYDLLRINPQAIQGIDFSRSLDLGSITKLGKEYIKDRAIRSPESLKGLETNYSGYVFERLSADYYQKKGIEITFPDKSNNPGYDYLFANEPHQAKASITGINGHFEKYPDIPVVTTSDAAKVFLQQNPDKIELIKSVPITTSNNIEITKETLAGSAEVIENQELFEIPIPEILGATSIVTLYKNFNTDISIKAKLRNIGLDTVYKGIFGTIGGGLGFTLGGPILAPVGAGLGIWLISKPLKKIKLKLYCEREINYVAHCIENLIDRVNKISKNNSTLFKKKEEHLKNYFENKIETTNSNEKDMYEVIYEYIFSKIEDEISDRKKDKQSIKKIYDLQYDEKNNIWINSENIFSRLRDLSSFSDFEFNYGSNFFGGKFFNQENILKLANFNIAEKIVESGRSAGVPEDFFQHELYILIDAMEGLRKKIKEVI